MLNYTRLVFCTMLLLACCLLTITEARANSIVINTSTELLDASNFTPGTTYYLAFQLTGGGTDNNAVVLTNFSFDGGSVLNQDLSDPSFGSFLLGANPLDPAGIGQGLASLQLAISSGNAFSLYTQQLLAGSSFSFDFTPTNNYAFGSFDQFAFQIYDASLSTLLFEQTYDITGIAPEPVPEPATIALLAMGLFACSTYLRAKKRWRSS